MKGKLLLIPGMLLALGAIAAGISQPKATSAATFLDSIVSEGFPNGIPAETFDVVKGNGGAFNFVDKSGSVTLSTMNYNDGFFRTKEPLAVGEGKSTVVEFSTSDYDSGGFLCIGKGASNYGGCWGDMVMLQLNGNVAITATNIVPFTAAGVQTQWQALNTYINGSYRMVFNADGSAELYGKVAGGEYSLICYWAAGVFASVGSGYVAFMGNSFTGSVTLDNIKVGLADNKDLANLAYVVEEDFETPGTDKFVMDSVMINQAKCTRNDPAKYLVASSPDSGAGIIYKTSYTRGENSNKVVSMTATLALETLGEKAIGIATGLNGEVSDATTANFVGIKKNGTANELVLYVGGELKASESLGETSLDGTTAKLESSITYDGTSYTVTGTFGAKSVSSVTAFGEGRVGIAFLGNGTTSSKISKIEISNYKGVSKSGRDLAPTFEGGKIDHNWTYKSTTLSGGNVIEEDGHVYIQEDGMVRFKDSADGSYFATKHEYANFDLEFTCKKQQLEEDDDGNITPASTWIGVSLGKENPSDPFTSSGLIYFGVDTVDSLLNGQAGDRGWCGADTLMLNEANKDVMMKVHIRAEDGLVKTWLTNPANAEGNPILTRYNWDTAGYISFVSTAGGNFWIDDIKLTNLDGGTPNKVPVAVDASFDVNAGKTLTEAVVATDEDEGETLTYQLVEDNTASKGTLTFNEDGTFSYAAKDDATTGDVTFTYKAFDSEDYSETKTVTLHVIEKATEPIESSSSAAPTPSTSEDSVEPTPSTSETSSTSKGGCGGAIVGSSIAAVSVLGAVGIIAAKRKKEK